MSATKPTSSSSDAAKKSKGKVGEWVRHISSSGKEYYFNVTSHASQWEKPREWLDYEKKHGLVPMPGHPQPSSSSSSAQAKTQHHHQQQKPDRDAHHTSTAGHASSSHQAQQQQLLQQQRDRERHYHQQQQLQSSSTSASTSGVAHAHSSHSHPSSSQSIFGRGIATSSAQHHQSHSHHPLLASSSSFHQQGRHDTGFHVSSSSGTTSTDVVGSQRHFPDIQYPTTSSAAIASTSAAAREIRKPSEDLQAEDMDISPLDDDSPGPTLKVMGSMGSSSAGTSHSRGGELSSAHQSSHQSYFHRNYPTSSATGNNGHGSGFRERDRENRERESIARSDRDRDRERDRDRDRDVRDRDRDRERLDRDRERDRERDRDRGGDRDRDRDRDRYRDNRDRDRDVRERDYRDRGRGRDRGRDRPDRDTRERDRERSRSKLRDERRSSSADGTPERKHSGETAGGVGSLAALTQAADAEIPPLPQSLSMYFREDLIGHVKNLPGDIFERQANKLSEELVTNYAFQLSKVSTELKMARSLVRLTEIQSTLIEQRILFIRQQMKALEGDDNAASLGVETIDS